MEKQLSMLKDCFVCVKRKMTYTVSATRGYCVSDTRVVSDFIEDYASSMTECRELMYPKPESLAPGDTASLLKCFACVRRKLTYGLSSSRGYCLSTMNITNEIEHFNATAEKMTGCHSLKYPSMLTTEMPPLMETTENLAVNTGYINMSSWTTESIYTTMASIGSKLEAALASSTSTTSRVSTSTFDTTTGSDAFPDTTFSIDNVYTNTSTEFDVKGTASVYTTIASDVFEEATMTFKSTYVNMSQEFDMKATADAYTTVAGDVFEETTMAVKNIYANISQEFDKDVQDFETEVDTSQGSVNTTFDDFTEYEDVFSSTEIVPTEIVEVADSGAVLWSLMAFAFGVLLTLLAFKLIRVAKRRGQINFPAIPRFMARWTRAASEIELHEMNNNNTDV